MKNIVYKNHGNTNSIDEIYNLLYDKSIRDAYFESREEEIERKIRDKYIITEQEKEIEETKYNNLIDKVYHDTNCDDISVYYFENANKFKSLLQFDIINSKIYNNILLKDEINNIKFNLFNVELFELFNNNKCKICNNIVIKKMGYCIQHFNKFNGNSLHYDALKKITKLNVNELNELKLSLYKLHNDIVIMLRKCINIDESSINNYNIFYKTLTNFKKKLINENKGFIIYGNRIMYKDLINYYNNFNSKKQMNYNYDLSQNNFNLIKDIIKNEFKRRQCRNELEIFSNLKFNNTIRKLKCDNSEYIFEKIMCNQNINKWTYWVELEKNLLINNKNYRYDLYMIIKTKNNNFIDLIIETDEAHHYNDNVKRSDNDKDVFAITHGIAIIRIDLSASKIITDNIIKFVIKSITDIHFTNKPIYYFSDKYINFHTPAKGSTIVLPQHLKDTLKEPYCDSIISQDNSNNSDNTEITPQQISLGSSNKSPKKKLKENLSNEKDYDNNIIEYQKITIGSNKKRSIKKLL